MRASHRPFRQPSPIALAKSSTSIGNYRSYRHRTPTAIDAIDLIAERIATYRRVTKSLARRESYDRLVQTCDPFTCSTIV